MVHFQIQPELTGLNPESDVSTTLAPYAEPAMAALVTTGGRWLRALPLWVQDVLFAGALTAFTQYELWVGRAEVEGSLTLQRGAFAVMTLAVAWRRLAPLVAVCAVAVALVVQTVFGGEAPVVGGFLAMIIVTHSVATYQERLGALAGLVVMLAAVETYPLVNQDDIQLADEIGNAALFVVVWGLARAVRNRQNRAEELEDRATRLEREQEAQRKAAVEEERARIARELHDIVAHSVSIMVLQAGGARQLLGEGNERVRQSLLAVEEAGRQALGEMHRLLGILRSEDPGIPSAAQASLRQLDELAEQMRAAGLPVEVVVEGLPQPVAQSIDLSAYRIIQEALTNTLKHGGPTQARVVVSYKDSVLDLEITDTGRGRAKRVRRGGHGLVGMRERASLFGGSLQAGPRPGGGWVVRAQLPLASAER